MALGTAVMGKHTEIVKDLAPDPEDTAYGLFFCCVRGGAMTCV